MNPPKQTKGSFSVHCDSSHNRHTHTHTATNTHTHTHNNTPLLAFSAKGTPPSPRRKISARFGWDRIRGSRAPVSFPRQQPQTEHQDTKKSKTSGPEVDFPRKADALLLAKQQAELSHGTKTNVRKVYQKLPRGPDRTRGFAGRSWPFMLLGT